MPNILFPHVWVELKSDIEEFNTLGNSSRRNINVNFEIVCEVSTGYGQSVGNQVSDSEMIKLAQNLKNLFRSFPTLSSTVSKCVVASTEYGVEEYENCYNSSARIRLETYKLIS